MKRMWLVVGLSIALSGCFEKNSPDDGLSKAIDAASKIEIAGNSPDATVKSWWVLKDASIRVRIEMCKNNLKLAAPYLSKLSQLSDDSVVGRDECQKASVVFNREIVKVDVQSDTRAVVTAQIKNITPPDEGAVLDAESRKAKETGEPYQYILERKDVRSGWKITKISNFRSYAKEWNDINEKPKPSTNQYVYDAFQ